MKILLKKILLIASTVGTAISTVVILFLLVYLPAQGSSFKPLLPASTLPPFISATTAPGLPLRLLIPKINVNAAIESVGLTNDGAVGAPKVYANTAWFNAGPRPGEAGNAIIDGHYGWVKGRPVVFNNLSKLRPGDKVYVKDKTGAMIVFIVRELRTYNMKDDVAAVFNSSDGEAHLNLITCEGIWDKAAKTYSKRLVVFTDKE